MKVGYLVRENGSVQLKEWQFGDYAGEDYERDHNGRAMYRGWSIVALFEIVALETQWQLEKEDA